MVKQIENSHCNFQSLYFGNEGKVRMGRESDEEENTKDVKLKFSEFNKSNC